MLRLSNLWRSAWDSSQTEEEKDMYLRGLQEVA
jgi:hypothetical protein